MAGNQGNGALGDRALKTPPNGESTRWGGLSEPPLQTRSAILLIAEETTRDSARVASATRQSLAAAGAKHCAPPAGTGTRGAPPRCTHPAMAGCPAARRACAPFGTITIRIRRGAEPRQPFRLQVACPDRAVSRPQAAPSQVETWLLFVGDGEVAFQHLE